MQDTIKLLDINITTLSVSSTLEKIKKYINTSDGKAVKNGKEGKSPLTIYTPNPEIIMYAQRHKSFKEVVNKGQVNIPDGAGVVWASRRLGKPIRQRITGADFAYKVVELAAKENVTIGLIGGFGKIALRSLECLKGDFPRLTGWAEEGPKIECQMSNVKCQIDYGKWNIDEFIKKTKKENTKILFVAFGYPKQELFIDMLSKKLDNIVLMAVGGTFDYWSGNIPRAPQFIRDVNLEWLYRLVREPKRIQRQFSGSKFFLKFI